ncbi:MAG: hypothetical protein JNK92_05865 [Dechloromonas sp.]|nr:hypothetical protein [Dechloromonas sp.]
MSRHDARLAKLEAAMPTQKQLAQETSPGLSFRLDEFKAKLDAEQAHFDALTPAGKILSILAKIAEKTAEAALPASSYRNYWRADLGPQMHAFLVHIVNEGFPSEHFAVRKYEIAILDAAGYDTRILKSAHAMWEHFPWQWRRDDNQLPKEARSIIDRTLVAEGGTS